MKSLSRWLLKRLVARRPLLALQLGARRLGVEGVAVRVPPESPLFRAGDGEVVELPLDGVVASVVLQKGAWQLEEVAFLAAHAPARPCVLLDVGAHVGLVTRQLVHRIPAIARAVCFEPHAANFAYLRRNLAHLPCCHLVEAAVGAAEGTHPLFADDANSGNCSLLADAVRGARHRTSVVRAVPATVEALLASVPPTFADAPLLWKSDTQGLDEAIVTALPDAFWARVHAGVMELWRIARPAADRARLGAILQGFPVRRLSDAPEREASVEEILDYVAGDDRRQQDLFFARSGPAR